MSLPNGPSQTAAKLERRQVTNGATKLQQLNMPTSATGASSALGSMGLWVAVDPLWEKQLVWVQWKIPCLPRKIKFADPTAIKGADSSLTLITMGFLGWCFK